ncbi:MAG TPA: hypothetical protein VMV60_00680 [Thermoanaerobaculia bacterium]|nr:hypothetical protein [Thermoanaerobaculia bacterium]
MNLSPRALFAGLTTLFLATSGVADVDGGPNVKRLGATVMRWKDDTLQVIVGYKHAQLHLDKKWILLDTFVTATGGTPVEIWREDVALLAPDGTRIPLPSQRRMAHGIPDLRRMLNEANVQKDPLGGYFQGADREERLGFFAIPGEDIVFDKVTVNWRTLAFGPLFFPSPKERWAPGIYTLVIENRDVHVRLPLTLGVDGPLERVR